MHKALILSVIALFLLAGCASTEKKEIYTSPGPHYLDGRDKESVETLGNAVGMTTGAIVGLAAGFGIGVLSYNAIYGTPGPGQATPWLCVSSALFGITGGIIGWHIPYGVIGLDMEKEKKEQREKKIEEHMKGVIKD